jgi:hypothetical protein
MNRPTVFPLGVTTVTCSVTDSGGLTTSAPFTVTVHDTTAPVFGPPPPPIVAYATSTSGAVVSYTSPTALDAVDGTLTASCTPASGATFPPGKTTVICSVADGSGNGSTTSFDVRIQFQTASEGTFFLQPINPDDSSIFKLGSSIPTKFMLQGGSAGITNLVAHLSVAKVSNTVTGNYVEAVSTGASDPGNTFRYDSTGKQYIFNLSTKGMSSGTWSLRADLGDGVNHTAKVSLR